MSSADDNDDRQVLLSALVNNSYIIHDAEASHRALHTATVPCRQSAMASADPLPLLTKAAGVGIGSLNGAKRSLHGHGSTMGQGFTSSWMSVAKFLAISAALSYGSDQAVAVMARDEQLSEPIPGSGQHPFEMLDDGQDDKTASYFQTDDDHAEQSGSPCESQNSQKNYNYKNNNPKNLQFWEQKTMNKEQKVVKQVKQQQKQIQVPALADISRIERFKRFVMFYKDAHREQLIGPEQVAIAKAVESRMRDIFALMAMFILFERAMQLGAPNVLKRLKDQNEKDETGTTVSAPGSDTSGSGRTGQHSSATTSTEEQQVQCTLEQQMQQLQEENERLRMQIIEESNFNNASTDVSMEFPETACTTPQEQLERIKFQYQTDFEIQRAGKETLEVKYKKLKQISKFKKERADQLQIRLERAEEDHREEVDQLKEQLVQMTKSLALIVNQQKLRFQHQAQASTEPERQYVTDPEEGEYGLEDLEDMEE